MSTGIYDVAVVGLGAMGSATTYFLARAGVRVVGMDAYAPPHTHGSTHGRTRIIREAYFEDPSYVPLVRRAYENWSAVEQEAGCTLYTPTGGLMIGSPKSGLIEGTKASAAQHAIDVTQLSAADIERSFPALRVRGDMIGLLERRAGVLDPEACVAAYLRCARQRGAELRVDSRVTGIDADRDVITLRLGEDRIRTRRLVIAAGAWTPPLMHSLGANLPLMVERQVMHWFTPRVDKAFFTPAALPITLVEHEEGRYVYFIPDLGHGVKAAVHYEGRYVDPDADPRVVEAGDISAVEPLVATFAPSLAAAPHSSAVCLYTNTPDKHFVIDTVPGQSNVHIISACSGHGFKFASAIGEVVAGLALGHSPEVDVSAFRIARFD